MIRRFLITVLAVVVGLGANATSMEELWKSLPDRLIPYLDQSQRAHMTNYFKMGAKGEVENSLAGKSRLDTLTASYMRLTLNESVGMQLKKLPSSRGDSLICLVTTWKGPAEDSSVKIFSQEWVEQDMTQVFGGKALADFASELVSKPDTMGHQQFSDLQAMIDPVMVSATLFADSNQLKLNLSTPLLSADDKKKVQTIIHTLTLVWTGESFKEARPENESAR